jgi:DNA-binding beta-propeller fold protein YncE
MKISSFSVAAIGLGILLICIIFPASTWFFYSQQEVNSLEEISINSLPIIFRTFGWSFGIAIVSTIIGWPIGIRISTLQTKSQRAVVAMLVLTLLVPAYAIFYVWWQMWPSGTALHAYLVEKGSLGTAKNICLALALVGWSWPIPCLVSAMISRSDNSLTLLRQLDGGTLLKRCSTRLRYDLSVIIATVLLVMTFVASNTTSFDLAQVSTIGNELRGIIASGGSVFDVPVLSFVSFMIATITAILIVRFVPRKNRIDNVNAKSPLPVVGAWVLLSGLPLLVAMCVTGGAVFKLLDLYAGDIGLSFAIAFGVAVLLVVVLIVSAAMHLSHFAKIRMLAGYIDFLWLLAAFLPASLVANSIGVFWQTAGLEYVYRTPLILVLAHATKIAFVASLGGRWVGSCKNLKTLIDIDGVSSLPTILLAARHRLIISSIVVVAVSFTLSLGEVALTSQLSPPSTNQPIAVALLNAMHYQRPQIVTSALFTLILLASIGSIAIVFANKRILALCMFTLLVSCNSSEHAPIASAKVIGGVGISDGRFTIPRAIATNDDCIVVIDKSGRLQKFNSKGEFVSSWELELSGTGFPTGVTLDDESNIWIADTHQHRVLVLDEEGNELVTFGEYGTGDGQFLYPTDIAFGSDGVVFVSEYGGNDRISVFTKDGVFQYSFGYFGSDIDGFQRPQSMAFSPTRGNLFIADAGNHRIVERTPKGEVVQVIGGAGREQGELLYPYGISFDSQTTFLVCEFGNNRLQRFSIDGDALEMFGGAGDTIGTFKTPWAVEVGSKGIVVADTGNNRLQQLPDMMVY